MGRVYSMTVFRKKGTGGHTLDLGYTVNAQGLPQGAHVVCVMDDTGKQLFCCGLTPGSPADDVPLAEHVWGFVDVVRSEHDPDFGKRVPQQDEIDNIKDGDSQQLIRAKVAVIGWSGQVGLLERDVEQARNWLARAIDAKKRMLSDGETREVVREVEEIVRALDSTPAKLRHRRTE
jgi:hypothetical protein